MSSWPLHLDNNVHHDLTRAAKRIQRAFRWYICRRYKPLVSNWKEDDIFSQGPVNLIPHSLLIVLPCYGGKIKRAVSALDMVAWAFAADEECTNPYDVSEEMTSKQMAKIRIKASKFIVREIELWKNCLTSMTIVSPGDTSVESVISHLSTIIKHIGDVEKDFNLTSGYKTTSQKKKFHRLFVNAYSDAELAVEDIYEKLICEKNVVVDTIFQMYSVNEWSDHLRHRSVCALSKFALAVSNLKVYETSSVRESTQMHWPPRGYDTPSSSSSESSDDDEYENEEEDEDAGQYYVD